MAKTTEKTEKGDVKRRAIDMAVSTIEKQFGKGAILTMTEDSINREVDAFSAGSPSLDLALGIGATRADGWSRSTARSRAARPRSRSTRWPRCRRPAASPPSSTRSTPWT